MNSRSRPFILTNMRIDEFNLKEYFSYRISHSRGCICPICRPTSRTIPDKRVDNLINNWRQTALEPDENANAINDVKKASNAKAEAANVTAQKDSSDSSLPPTQEFIREDSATLVSSK